MTDLPRSQEEIVARIYAIADDDFFGAKFHELIGTLDFEHARPFLAQSATEESWTPLSTLTIEGVRDRAAEYLSFATDKALNHRGLSAARSVDHFEAFIWLAAPERMAEFLDADFQNYGVPQLKVAAEILGITDFWDSLVAQGPRLVPMSNGEPCRPNCPEGCDR